jgi:hypothetical protein
VRSRYDAQRQKRFKTVELLVAERDWDPPRPRFTPEQIVGLRVAITEAAVRERVKQAGGTWNQRDASGSYATIARSPSTRATASSTNRHPVVDA